MSALLGLMLAAAAPVPADSPSTAPASAASADWTRPPVGALGPPAFPVPQVLALSDGTPVWLVERHDLPLVRVGLVLAQGWLGAPRAEAAQALGPLVGHGTRGLEGPAWAEALDGAGARLRVDVGASFVRAEVEATGDGLPRALELLSASIRQPELRPRTVRPLRQALLRERLDGWRSPGLSHEVAVARTLYGPGPPGAPADLRALRRLRPSRLRAAWRDLTARGEAAIVVAGDTTPAAILPLLERNLSGFSGTARPAAVPRARWSGRRVVLVDHRAALQALVTVTFPAASGPADELVNHLLGGSFTSRLSRRLREKEGLTYAIDSQLLAHEGRVQIDTRVDPDRLVSALDAIREVLDSLARDPPTADELAAAKHAAFLDSAIAMTSLAGLVGRLEQAAAYGEAPDAERARLARTAAVDEAALAAAARRLGEQGDRVWVVTGDRSLLEPVMEAHGWGPDTVWSARALFARRPPVSNAAAL